MTPTERAAARGRYLAQNRRRWLDGLALLDWTEWLQAGRLRAGSGSQPLTRSLPRAMVSGRLRPQSEVTPPRATDKPRPAPQTESPSVVTARERRRRTAWHEAAHALVAYLIGLELVYVDLGGATTTYRASIADQFGSLVVTMAGLAADWLAGGESAASALDGAMIDREEAAKVAARLDPLRLDGVMHQAQALAGGLVDRHWTAAERLAEALVVSGRMEGDRLADAIEAALEGLDLTDWITRRRAALDAAGDDPAAREAAWLAAGRRWHGSARSKIRAIYDELPAGRREREQAATVRHRNAFEALVRDLPPDTDFAPFWRLAEEQTAEPPPERP
jgi:hypothetical protein